MSTRVFGSYYLFKKLRMTLGLFHNTQTNQMLQNMHSLNCQDHRSVYIYIVHMFIYVLLCIYIYKHIFIYVYIHIYITVLILSMLLFLLSNLVFVFLLPCKKKKKSFLGFCSITKSSGVLSLTLLMFVRNPNASVLDSTVSSEHLYINKRRHVHFSLTVEGISFTADGIFRTNWAHTRRENADFHYTLTFTI